MLPLKREDDLITEFLLMRNRNQCCFGKPLAVNEWIHVHMVAKGVKDIMDQPITVYGKLHVGEYSENHQLLGIYRLDGKKMEGP
jgi:hypothetical protein